MTFAQIRVIRHFNNALIASDNYHFINDNLYTKYSSEEKSVIGKKTVYNNQQNGKMAFVIIAI